MLLLLKIIAIAALVIIALLVFVSAVICIAFRGWEEDDFFDEY